LTREGGPAPRLRPFRHAAIAAGVLLGVGLGTLIVSGPDALVSATPTPAALQERGVPAAVLNTEAPKPKAAAIGPGRVRLKRDVLVHTAPSAESPRPAISMLGAGMIANVRDRQGEWVLIEYGPLLGWTRSETVDAVE